MTSKFVTVPALRDFGAGLDAESAENQVPEGYVEDIVNGDPQPSGYISKRRGFEGHGGWIPLRVKRLLYTDEATNNFQLFFDESIDLSNFRSSPLIIHGKTSSQNTANVGDFPNNQVVTRYYPTFVSSEKRTFHTGTNSFLVEGDSSASILWTGVTRSTSTVDNSNSHFLVDSIEQDKINNEITIGYTNGGASYQGYIYLADKSTTLGEVFNSVPTAQPAGTVTTNVIGVSTHGLSSTNLIVKCFEDTGTHYREVLPEHLEIDTDGNVSISIDNRTDSSINIVFSLSAAPASNVVSGTAASGASTTVEIPGPLSSSFLFASCYLEQTIGGTREMVIPESISVNAATGTAQVIFTNSTPSAANFFVYWEEVELTSNKASLGADIIGVGFEDTEPQLTVWGISHEGLYPEGGRGGWANHLDSYRSSTTNRLVTALGGNFFTEALYSDTSDRSTYLLPSLITSLRGRVSTSIVVGPAFTSDTSERSRGYLSSSNTDEDGRLPVRSLSCTEEGKVLVTLDAAGFTLGGVATSLSDIFTTEDYLTLSNTGYNIHEGTHPILSVSSPDPDTVEVTISNPSVVQGDWDEPQSAAFAAIYSDILSLLTDSPFLAGDLLGSTLFENQPVLQGTDTRVVIGECTSLLSVPSGLRLVGKRSASSVIPLRTGSEVESTQYLVRGDMLQASFLSRMLRIISINSLSDTSVSLEGDGEIVTLTFTDGITTTATFSPGDRCLLVRAGPFSGEFEVSEILSETTLTFESTTLGTGTGVIKGHTIGLDDTLEWQDEITKENTLTVTSRWKPIETQEAPGDLIPPTRVVHRDYLSLDELPIERSTLVADNLYLTNGTSEVLRFDGQHLAQAGLPKWQPSLFVTTDTSPSSGGSISLDSITLTVTSVTGTQFRVAAGQEVQLRIGDRITHSSDGASYTVTNVGNDGTNGIISVSSLITGAGSGTLKKHLARRYYFRLNAVDANRNLIGSAVSFSEDFLVELSASAQVRLRLLSPPAFGMLDFAHLELEIYGTKLSGIPPFYRLATIPLTFDGGAGYIDFLDTLSDDTLRDLDVIHSALKGAELGTAFSEPLRSKVITSVGNRLILGNVSSYPEMDIRLVPRGSRITTSTLAGLTLTLRKNNEDSGTVTDNQDRFTFEFVTGSTSLVPATDITSSGGTSFTVASTAHGLSVGDWVYLFHSAVEDGRSPTFSGWFQITSLPDANSFTVEFPHDSSYVPSAADVDRYAVATDSRNVPVFLGTDGNFSMRSGNREAGAPYEFLAAIRLSHAINAAQRMNRTETFRPWILALAGNDYQVGQVVLKQPLVLPDTFEVQLPDLSAVDSTLTIYVNDIRRSSEEQVSAITRHYPSRLLVSYPNYPEVFDAPLAVLDAESESAIDIHAADGQQITGVLPFFGDSAFGDSQRSSILVVWKEDSIFVVDLNAKAAGQPCVQKLQTNGVGCSAPGSISVTRDGINFVHSSGIYRLNRSLGIDYVGRKLGRLWKERVNRDALSLAASHNYTENQQWRLSFPPTGEESPSEQFIYKYTRGEGGAWSRYTGFPALLWANLGREAFFSSTRGEVFRLRNRGENSDYRDDASPIPFEVTFRGLDFGDSGIRKSVGNILVHFRSLVLSSSIRFLSATNLSRKFEEADPFILRDATEQKAQTLAFSIDDRKANFFQFRLSESTQLDTPVEITHLDVRVLALTEKGIEEAASSTKQ